MKNVTEKQENTRLNSVNSKIFFKKKVDWGWFTQVVILTGWKSC